MCDCPDHGGAGSRGDARRVRRDDSAAEQLTGPARRETFEQLAHFEFATDLLLGLLQLPEHPLNFIRCGQQRIECFLQGGDDFPPHESGT